MGLVVLVSPGYASFPDPPWIDAIYNDADCDEIARGMTDRLAIRPPTSPPEPSTMGAGPSQALVLVERAALELVVLAAPVRLAVGVARGRPTRGPPVDTACLCSPPAPPCSSPRDSFGNG